MKFKTFQLIIGGLLPTKADMKKVVDIGQGIFRPGVELFEVERAMLNNRFFWMSCQYDNAELYTDHVWNEDAKCKEINPRTKAQIECRQQLFVCYDTETGLLYMSNMDKRSFLKTYLSETLAAEVEIKNIIKSLDEFQRTVKWLKSARFVQAKNLFTINPGSIFNRTADIYGLDAPDHLMLRLDYDATPIALVKATLKTLGDKLHRGEFESVIIIGENDDGAEQSFDFSSMIESITIAVQKDGNGHFDAQEVQTALLKKLG